MSKNTYDTNSIIKMEDIEHIRHNSGMYVGDTQDATRLAEEILDNALDEVQGGHCNIIGLFVNTKTNEFKILDNGRGIPWDENKNVKDDTPVIICTSLFTSGKFKKKDKDSAYSVASGLHGVGMSAVYALSDKLKIEIYRDKKKATYDFHKDGNIERVIETHEDAKTPFSTKIEVRPCSKYFDSTSVNLKRLEERLKIACANFPKLKIIYAIDDKPKVIDITEKDIINDELSSDITDWIELEVSKTPESCKVVFAWDRESYSTCKAYTTVNLCKVRDGVHVVLLQKLLKEFFVKEGAKRKIIFDPNDVLIGLKIYIRLSIINTAFSEQVKDRLASRSDISIMELLEAKISEYFKKNEKHLIELLAYFHEYRQTQTNKKLVGKESTKRGSSKLTKLRDCSKEGGELIIGEGDSAVGGLIQVRDPSKHAILPLRGLVPNAITKKNFHENPELKDIIQACGCGIGKSCDVSKLRYSKIILAADADPAGHQITALLITLFGFTMPDVIKSGKLFVCKTPLYGTWRKNKFTPLWEKEEVDKAIASNERVTRFKGLGEFNPRDLKVFTLDESTRNLIKVEWSDKSEKLFKLMSTPAEKKKLSFGEWSIDD